MGCASTASDCSSSNCNDARNANYNTLASLVQAYVIHCEKDRLKEIGFFAEPTEIKQVISRGVRSKLWCEKTGKLSSHQKRIGAKRLEDAVHFFQQQAKQFGEAENFNAIHTRSIQICNDIHGLGPLTAYDIATRIAASRAKYPDKVYLHSGTKDGAKALGFRESKSLSLATIYEAYPEMMGLGADSLENLFCIFKAQLGKFRRI